MAPGDEYLDVEDSINARVDFPEGSLFGGPVVGRKITFTYANGSDTDLPMALWVGDSASSQTIVFPPTGGWNEWDELSLPVSLAGAAQISLTALDARGGPNLRTLTTTWLLDCTSGVGCGYSLPEVGDCPSILPGIPAPEPMAPVARFTVSPRNSSAEPAVFEFDGSQSSDRNWEPISYRWSFAEGVEMTGESVSRFLDVGYYYVLLEVTDPGGLVGRYSSPVAVSGSQDNEAPTAIISAPRRNLLRPYTTTTLSAAGSSDPEGDPLRYSWRVSESREVFYGESAEVTVAETGNVDLAVSDGIGGYDRAYVTLQVEDVPEYTCSIRYINLPDKFRVLVSLYNVTDTPIVNWQTTWTIDEAENVSPYNGAEMSGSNPYVFSGAGGFRDIPAYSWVEFSFEGESDQLVQDINFVHDIQDCDVEMPAQ